MISRSEKNKKYINEINHEKTVNFFKKIFKLFFILLFSFTLVFLYTYFLGVKGLKTKEYKIIDENIPKSFDGIKILHFSDLWYGKTILKNDLDKLQKEIELVNPDIVFFTGDIVSNDYTVNQNDIKIINTFLKSIPYKLGKYAILGDMDKNNFNLIMDNTNFTILNNEKVDIYNNNKEAISIIGLNINDISSHSLSSNNYTITLIHNYDKYSQYNIHSHLVLAGHNLGGEIKLINQPLLGNNTYNLDYYLENNTKVYISSGLGTMHHMRLFNKPSINVYRLYVE